MRVLIAKAGLDGHDRGAKVITQALRDAGMDVLYSGLRQTPEMIVHTALREDVACLGLSILSGAHKTIVPRILSLLRDLHAEHILVVVGGAIPVSDVATMKAQGVAAVFGPGTRLATVVEFIAAHAGPLGTTLRPQEACNITL
jgi:methylmalonyl-CoA mutase C-terminal domain/subunit